MPSAVLHDIAVSLVGADAAREGTAVDAVDGAVPRIVVEPSTPEVVGALMEWASREKLAVLVRGSGTKMTWGPVPHSIDVLLSTVRLNQVVAHRHGDLTATIQTGATLAAVNRALAQHRQWIPLDPPMAGQATIGGIVAANDSGPRRHRYGAPRDLIIGVEFVRADGCLAKGGGIVVKNVAGYDLPRLLTGSFGSLGVMVSATFKLYPLTTSSRTVVIDLATLSQLSSVAGRFLASHLTPTALEFSTHPLRLLVRFESIEASVVQQTEATAALAAEVGLKAAIVPASDEDRVWTEHAELADGGTGALLKVSVLPGDLGGTLEVVERLAGAGWYKAAGRAGLGVFSLRVSGDVDLQARVIEGLRGYLAGGKGSAVIVAASPELKSRVDVWGPVGDARELMKAVKQQFDPEAVLNRGRGPGGI